jgi:phage shock protein C
MTTKRLMRSRDDKLIAGVCAGLAHYFEVDPTLMRLGFVLLLLMGAGSPLLVYLLLWLVMPMEGSPRAMRQPMEANVNDMAEKAQQVSQAVQETISEEKNSGDKKV